MTWSGRRIVHFAEADQLPVCEFLPIKDGAFAAYDIFTNRSATLRFEPTDDGKAQLKIVDGQSEHFARRHRHQAE